jgi:TP901 family phage tail tape measure protein
MSAGGIRAGGAYVEIFAKDGKFQQAMTRVQQKLRAVGASMRQIGTNLSIGGAALGAPFVLAAKTAADFTSAMAGVKANTGATEEQFARLNESARKMGVAMGRSPVEVANAMSELAKAGLDAEGVMKSIGPILAVAAADGMELGRAVEVVVSTMSQFAMTTNDFGSIADKLQAAANASTTSVDLIGESLSYVGPSAAAAGQSFDEVAAAIATLAQAGIKGSMAGTSLSRIIQALAEEEGQLNALGVSVRNVDGSMRPFIDVLRDLGDATKGMSNTDRGIKFNDIFDIRGANAAKALSGMGAQFSSILDEIVNSEGEAAKKSAIVLASFGGAVKQLVAAFDDLKIALITSMGEGATAVVKGLQKALEVVTQLVSQFPAFTATVAVVAGGLLALGVGAIAGGIALQVLSKGISVVTTAVTALATPWGMIAAIAVGGIALITTAAYQLSPAFAKEFDAIWAAVQRLDFAAAFGLLFANTRIVFLQFGKWVSDQFRFIGDAAAAAGLFIADKLTEGLDRVLEVFGTDIIAMQAMFQKLGAYFRAAFDWDFAVNGLRKALQEIDAQVERERQNAPTANDRAGNRRSERDKAAANRQAANDKADADFQAKLNRARDDAAKARERAIGKKEPEKKTEPTKIEPRAVSAPGPMMGKQDKPDGGDGTGKKSDGIGATLGTFGQGSMLGIGPELADGANAQKQTAQNTAAMATTLDEMAAILKQDPAKLRADAAAADAEAAQRNRGMGIGGNSATAALLANGKPLTLDDLAAAQASAPAAQGLADAAAEVQQAAANLAPAVERATVQAASAAASDGAAASQGSSERVGQSADSATQLVALTRDLLAASQASSKSLAELVGIVKTKPGLKFS